MFLRYNKVNAVQTKNLLNSIAAPKTSKNNLLFRLEKGVPSSRGIDLKFSKFWSKGDQNYRNTVILCLHLFLGHLRNLLAHTCRRVSGTRSY